MKPQDIIFIIILLVLFWKNEPKYLVRGALLCLVLAIPLFYKLIFFTAERLVMYAGGLLLFAIILFGIKMRK